MSIYHFSGVGYGFGNYRPFDSIVGIFVIICLIAFIIFAVIMLIKAIRNKK